MLELEPTVAIALVLALGAAAQWLAWRISIPAILPLLIIGFLVGPVFGLVNPTELFGTELLFPAVSLAVGLILFEGGSTLRIPDVRETSRVVLRLVTIGGVITWVGAAAAAYLITDLSLPLAFLFGALVLVTGPTVIGPLLRIVRPTARVANVLRWEGILIDPLGAMAAVLVFEFLVIDNRVQALGQSLLLFGEFIAVGTIVGALGGIVLAFILRRRLLPDYLLNLTALAFVFGIFALSSTIAPESGLLATVVMGMMLANQHIPNLEDVLSFKEDLSILFISTLFVTLAANVSMDALLATLNWPSLLLLAVMILVIRPLNIFICAAGSKLGLNEKLYLSWIAPRGVVAASVTSLFAFRLQSLGYEGANALIPLVFLIIVGTVTLNSLTARLLAERLGVAEPDPQGFLILGAHSFARQIGEFLQREDFNVLLADTNWTNVAMARVEGLNAYYGSLLSAQSNDDLRLSGIGKLLALTSNDEANALTALKYARDFGTQQVYQLEPGGRGSDRSRLGNERRGRTLFREGVTYSELSKLFNRSSKLKKTSITETFDLEDFEERHGQDYLPMFVISGKKIRVITEESPPPDAGSTLVSLVLEPKAEENAKAVPST